MPEITVYRFSSARLVGYLQKKVRRLSDPDVFERSRTLIRGLAKDGLMEDGREDLLKGANAFAQEEDHLMKYFVAGRIRAACDLVGQYIPHTIRTAMLASFEYVHHFLFISFCSPPPCSFAKLDAHLKLMQDDEMALAVTNTNTKKKDSDKSKERDGDKKRKNTSKSSQGVEKLKKTSTTGMAKMSTFFKKAA
jgi:ribonuclease H2 subunit B